MLQLEYEFLHNICLNYCTLKRNKASRVLLSADTQSEELNSLMATGRNDFLWRSVVGSV